jgi:predicted metal-dependent phosphoesterase TrpH
MFAFDLHIHTSRHSPDSGINPFALMRHARQLGLAGIVITEHDWLWSEEELEELRAATPGVQVYAGVEVSAHEGHFLCYGVSDLGPLGKGITLRELCTAAHAQGGVVIAAHPFRWGQDFEAIAVSDAALDGLEIMSSNMDEALRAKAKETLQRHHKRWAVLGNSDAHTLETVGVCYSEFAEAIRDQADLIEALRSGYVEPHERLRSHLEIEMLDDALESGEEEGS